MAEVNDQVPEVMVEHLEDINVINEQNIQDSNEGQLKRPPSATPRNRSPVTIQEWVDSLTTTVDQKLIFIKNLFIKCTWWLIIFYIINIFREDFDNVESSTLLNSLDADNLKLGAEGNILSIAFLFQFY